MPVNDGSALQDAPTVWSRRKASVAVCGVIALLVALGGEAVGQGEARGPGRSSRFRHAVVVHEQSSDFRGLASPPASWGSKGVRLRCRGRDSASYVSREIEAPFPFDRLLPSWNVGWPSKKECGFSVALRVRGRDGSWSPWLDFGGWGMRPVDKAVVTRWKHGRVVIDDLLGTTHFVRVQYRVTARGDGDVFLRRFALCFSAAEVASRPRPPSPTKRPPRRLWARRLPVPFISQKTEDPRIAHRNCSPTSLTMVMAYRGVRKDKNDVARRIFDLEHDIYGNWNRALQGAYTYGVPGYLARFSDWDEVKSMIAKGQPLVISIKAKKGELTGAPYTWTAGHLLVLCGFDGKGGVFMNDPAAGTARHGKLTYAATELSKVWLDKGGTAYVLLPRP